MLLHGSVQRGVRAAAALLLLREEKTREEH
jgi:hypothetical protein